MHTPTHKVTAAMDGSDPSGVKPALGLAWADMVTTRLMLYRPEAVETEVEYQKVYNVSILFIVILHQTCT